MMEKDYNDVPVEIQYSIWDTRTDQDISKIRENFSAALNNQRQSSQTNEHQD